MMTKFQGKTNVHNADEIHSILCLVHELNSFACFTVPDLTYRTFDFLFQTNQKSPFQNFNSTFSYLFCFAFLKCYKIDILSQFRSQYQSLASIIPKKAFEYF